MKTLHATLSDLRVLRDEETDLIGGAWSMEGTYYLTRCNVPCTGGTGCPHSVPDDSNTDVQFD